MLTTPHALTGAALGVAIGDPYAAFAAGIAGHYLLDAIPHTDPQTWHSADEFPFRMHAGDLTLGFADLAVTFYGTLLLAGEAPIVAAAPLAGIVGSILPDVIGLSPLFFPKIAQTKWFQSYHELAKRYHHGVPPQRWVLGIVTQAVVILGSVWYLLGS